MDPKIFFWVAHVRSDLKGRGALTELTYAAVCLAFLVYKGPKMKRGICCIARKKEVERSMPTLRSLANFWIELERFCLSLSELFTSILNSISCLTINEVVFELTQFEH